MTRGLSAGNLTAIAAAHIRPIVFVALEFDGGTEYIHNAVGNYVTLGQTWQGIGALGEVSPIEEGLDLSPFAVSFQLNALNSDLMAIVQGEEPFNRRATIYIGYLDDNGVLVADPQIRWRGLMDNFTVRLGMENGIALAAESHLRFFDRANGSLFTDEHQQRRYSGDLFFQFQQQIQDAQITWGPGGRTNNLGRPGEPRTNPGTTYDDWYSPNNNQS